VCGIGAPGRAHRRVQDVARFTIVADLGPVHPEDRCRNCASRRAAFGQSSAPVLGAEGAPPSPELAEVAAAAAATVEVSASELELMIHTTGWRSKWPLYRNHFCAGEGHADWTTIEGLIARGLMRETRKPSSLSGGDSVFGVTAIGIATLKRHVRAGTIRRARSGKTEKRSEQTG
jgi:hypothetical protein